MEKSGTSLSDLREAGATRELSKAEVETSLAINEVKETSRKLRERISEARARNRGLARQSFATVQTTLRLPPVAPLAV
jgi:hypothetical protein